MATKSSSAPRPEEQPLTKTRARWLAQETGIPVKELAGKQIGQVDDLIRPHIDPELLLFRKVCGRVVKRDPVTGEDFGVPNATVHVEDTDFSFLGYYPTRSPYWWIWPFLFRREEIAHVRTDACGRFCVRIPRWDIDRILRLRRKLVCEPVKPNITEVLHRIYEEIEWPQRPIPDPGPLRELPLEILPRVRDELGPQVASQLAGVIQRDALADPEAVTALLNRPAFGTAPPSPPLERGVPAQLHRLEHPALREAKRLGAEKFDPGAFVGPFLRCHFEWALEWQTVVDVPDITFRVTQDVDGDGDEETIYSEGFFDVRWNAGAIPDVTLHANPIALATPFCGTGEARECTDKPALYVVGTMPLTDEYHDSESGYALRVNRAREGGLPSGAPIEPAQTPYARYLALMACHRLPGATHQRVMCRRNKTDSPVPLLVPSWLAPSSFGHSPPLVPFSQDAEGWIEIRDKNSLAMPDWVLYWPTPLNGHYYLHVECKDASGHIVGSPGDEVAFTVDNAACSLGFGTVRWRVASSGSWQPLPEDCPVIRRPAGAAIELEVPWSADSPHFRSAHLSFTGCGYEAIPADTGPITYEQWHDSVADMHGGETAYYTVPGEKDDGAYALNLEAWTRAFQPTFDAGPLTTSDFRIDPSWIWSHQWRAIAIVTQC